jgi:hypothetical protein
LEESSQNVDENTEKLKDDLEEKKQNADRETKELKREDIKNTKE